eukprot:m.1003794 g.1003794  ORF g.1003794 m.1003794 type:complete len:151 (+) comp24046_c1_seq11:585-1037(+)
MLFHQAMVLLSKIVARVLEGAPRGAATDTTTSAPPPATTLPPSIANTERLLSSLLPVALELLGRFPAGDTSQRPVVYRFVRAVVRSVRLAWSRVESATAGSTTATCPRNPAPVDEWLGKLMSFCTCVLEHCTVHQNGVVPTVHTHSYAVM